ncbi:MAG: type II toxin-antitoxin system RelE/ParE family toxin [Burkholderiales bacterium]
MALTVLATPSFSRAVKKLHERDKKVVDKAVGEIAMNPGLGEERRGDLAGVFVHKFNINMQRVWLDYRLRPDKAKPTELVLLSLGSHESFYAGLKR